MNSEFTINLVVVGDKDVGKTSLIKAYYENKKADGEKQPHMQPFFTTVVTQGENNVRTQEKVRISDS